MDRIKAGELVPFTSDLRQIFAIRAYCEQDLGGFMDENFADLESRERFFRTQGGYDCFKTHDQNGIKQGNRLTPERLLEGKAYHNRGPGIVRTSIRR